MSANVKSKIEIKSAEQRMIERATAEFISKLRVVLGTNTKSTIQISGVSLSKLATIAEFLKDEEQEPVKIKSRKSFLGNADINYIYHSIKGAGYEIEEISE